jgi:CHASE2 domain-containing sensor protein
MHPRWLRCSALKYWPGILGCRALPTWRLARLGATPDFYHGLLASGSSWTPGNRHESVRKVIAGLLLGVGAALVILLLGWTGVLDRLELQLYDWSLRQSSDPKSVNQDIVLVEINDASIRDYSQAVGRWPWPRVLQSNLIDFLQRAPARVIAYDIQLSEKSSGSF